ncbi:hypothetical protein SBA3_2410022 [Candidatus Sulfopaludibacter sp. SbA3]|nr:hypothetical protein SBA3_2410022 [Candidatus Sulfopaludibacter sp. SbA3]
MKISTHRRAAENKEKTRRRQSEMYSLRFLGVLRGSAVSSLSPLPNG